MESLADRYSRQIVAQIRCFDRVLISGMLPEIGHAKAMTGLLVQQGVEPCHFARWAQPRTDSIRANAERMAAEAGLKVQFLAKVTTRKEEIAHEVLRQRGDEPGLVCILSAMETCDSYKSWWDRDGKENKLRWASGRCLHYYFYFIDPDVGLCHVRVPTWAPFRLQFYFNGHNHLAAKLRRAGIEFQMRENAFTAIADTSTAQQLADDLDVASLHALLDRYAALCCPPACEFRHKYHWSLMQVEYSTDLIFRRQDELKPLYEHLSRTAIHAAKPGDVATFLGRKLTDDSRDEVGNRFSTRIEGTRIRHTMGPASIKMYDKFSLVLRVETTVNDVSFLKHHRPVEQKDGTRVVKLAQVRKTIYSLPDLQELLAASNQRYLAFLAALDDPSQGARDLPRVTEPRKLKGRTYRGVNFYAAEDLRLLEAIASGETVIRGIRTRDLRPKFPTRNTAWLSRRLRALRIHHLLRRVGRTYKYYLTDLGKRVIAAGLVLRQCIVIPSLAGAK